MDTLDERTKEKTNVRGANQMKWADRHSPRWQTKFALSPVKIGQQQVWLERYQIRYVEYEDPDGNTCCPTCRTCGRWETRLLCPSCKGHEHYLVEGDENNPIPCRQCSGATPSPNEPGEANV